MSMQHQQKANVILISNAVFTGLTDMPVAASIAICGNMIAAIGSEEDLQPWIGPETKIYRFDDQLIMPGFHDFHLHIILGSIFLDSVYLHDARSEEEAAEMVKEYAESRPEEQWIIGFSWDAGYWQNKQLPHRSSLDKVLPDRPAILFQNDGHYAWVNSKALEVCNVTKDTENPQFGSIEKDENGEPTGIIYEHAMALFTNKAYHLSKGKKMKTLTNFFRHAARLGITAMNDLYATEAYEILEDYEIFKEFEDNGGLTTRIHLLPVLNSDLDRAKRLKETYQSSMLRVVALKQFVDGVVTGYTAHMLEPYSNRPDTCGDTAFPPDVIKKWVADADKEGFSIRFHALGDGAVRLALDAFEEAQKVNGIRDSRHSIEHIEVIHPNDIHRFQELGVIASIQPDHMYAADRETYISCIGEDRGKYAWATKSILDTGAKVAISSDFPIVGLNPMPEIHRAVTRIDNSNVQQWNPEQSISLADALKGYTVTPAYGTFREHELGTLEVGKLADIVVLDRNLFAVPSEEILDTIVKLTMVDGKIVFQDGEFS
ncbi:amidohydrolase [Brevibacillus choshinensis]|uniref:Amidohydrolase n=1 Tax=Brevibacillus choshinensis TaxID=54911 RepID=A0ABR5NDT9_BRECH|nr:amidohydrolase [Brevibacillus choshinensis]KQL49677.1 amidohydrolase [Brevibacillus choshinensis]